MMKMMTFLRTSLLLVIAVVFCSGFALIGKGYQVYKARVPQFQGHTGAHVSGTPDDDKGTESFLHHDKNASCRASRQGPGDARTGCLCPVPGRRMVACTRVPGLMPEEETTRKERS